jgi:uncharacterized protein (DUF1501 family)
MLICIKELRMNTRRQFLQQSALISLAPLVPAFIARSASAENLSADDRVLVVIQLDGGNDGLNTVIPFADENYARFRRELRIKSDDILKLDSAVGLNPAMKTAADLFQDGRLTVVQGVGYPNPNRSHFESMAIWHHARLDSGDHDGNGWLGRASESIQPRNTSTPDSIYVGADGLPAALRGRRSTPVALQNESDLKLAVADVAIGNQPDDSQDIAAFVQRSVAQSYEAARRFRESNDAKGTAEANYPGTKLGEKLKLVAKLLKLGGGTRIFYVSQPGYDTHAAQLYPHADLLREFAGGLKAFLNDLKSAKLDDRVVVLAFSEFGRRVEENGSAGTDHGAAGPVFLAGSKVRGGIVGSHPSLTDLDRGDLKMAIDFREVYATLLAQWLGVSSTQTLRAEFAQLNLLS